MKKIQLEPQTERDGVVVLSGSFADRSFAGPRALRYPTRTGALLRIDGAIVGAFDREHATVPLPSDLTGADVTIEVERHSLPSAGLPAGPGLRWSLMQLQASSEPARVLEFVDEKKGGDPSADTGDLPLLGHGHLDVAWLWTYAETRRKALRTFATAARLLDANPAFRFTQSQPQLYAFVRELDPAFFERVQRLTRSGRFDASGAALWVEPDCNIPSGESLLRQLVHGIRFAREFLGTTPTVAWLPDSFGFANTLPTLLVHAGVRQFATTKLRWNDTTEFPYPQFMWEGPDGGRVFAAIIAAYGGGIDAARLALARLRREPLVLGYGDGGGGVTDEMIEKAPAVGRWTTLAAWFEDVRERTGALPVHRDELYLEYHRGVFTTRHDIKARNAVLERTLGIVEEQLAWCLVLRASKFFLDEMRGKLREAWEIVLRNQFHDVLPGTSIAAVYADVHQEYDRAESLLGQIAGSAAAMLPRPGSGQAKRPVEPVVEGTTYLLENAHVRARLRADGTIVELRVPGGPNLVAVANVFAAYVDAPAKWDAWNIDSGYERKTRPVRFEGARIIDDAVEVQLRVGKSVGVIRLWLVDGDPYLRVDFAIDWRERHTLLRTEHALALSQARVRFGTPHGSIDRPTVPRTPGDGAKFEFCAQRFARVQGQEGSLGILTLDTYGWNLKRGATDVQVGNSLLRGPLWPDPAADLGEQAFSLAFAPLVDASLGSLERLWQRFAGVIRVPLFSCDDPAILVVAVKPADDGDGVIVRARECDGGGRTAKIACGARAASVACVNALEAAVPGDAELEDGAIVAWFAPYALRSFRVRLSG